MKYILTIILILIYNSNSYSQNISCEDVEILKSYFEEAINEKSIEPFKTIPKELAFKIFNDKRDTENVVNYYAMYLIPPKKPNVAIIGLMLPQGGYTSITYMLFISEKCNIEKMESICYTHTSIDGGRDCGLKMINDSLLELEVTEFEFNDNEEEIILGSKFSYYIINNQGFSKINCHIPSVGRLYPQISIRILSIDELEDMNNTSLDIMRNEIFADYGYIFKTIKWKKYFRDKDWYIQRYEDVNDKLTIIEKINIKNILQVSSDRARLASPSS